jgi:hypothetical protein
MMKNTLTVNRDEAARSYADFQLEHLNCSLEGLHTDEFADAMCRVAEDIRNLVSENLEVSRGAFKTLFRDGFAASMLPGEIDTLEKWLEAKEEFQVIVFTADGKPVGCFNQDQVQW